MMRTASAQERLKSALCCCVVLVQGRNCGGGLADAAAQSRFEIDFLAEGLGRPHIMRFGSEAFYKGRVASEDRRAGLH